MKIEKLNENQIRCTLTREDLANRKLKLSELAYGGEKAKSLFRDMMQQAAYECGFEANDIPLMIEAIPTSADTLILIITKVEDPEELDTRFAKFAPGDAGDNYDISNVLSSMKPEGADDILNLFQKIREAHKALAASKSETASVSKPAAQAPEEDLQVEMKKLYVFHHLDDVIQAARILHGIYQGSNSLYKTDSAGEYHLILSKSSHTPEEFNRVCNIISEYAATLKFNAGSEAYLAEHGHLVVGDQALQRLGSL